MANFTPGWPLTTCTTEYMEREQIKAQNGRFCSPGPKKKRIKSDRRHGRRRSPTPSTGTYRSGKKKTSRHVVGTFFFTHTRQIQIVLYILSAPPNILYPSVAMLLLATHVASSSSCPWRQRGDFPDMYVLQQCDHHRLQSKADV